MRARLVIQNKLSSKVTDLNTASSLANMEHVIDIEIGARIRQYRRGVGLTQKNLAEKLGMQYQVIQKYEKATTKVSLSRLIAITRILGVKPSVFFDGLSPFDLARSDRAADFHNTNTAIDMSRALSQLPKSSQRAIVNMVRELAAEPD